MNRNRKMLYLNTTLARGRRLRDENEGAGGAGAGLANGIPDNGAGGQGNSGGNSGNPGSESNNTGETFDPTTFWDSPAEENNSTPSGESAGNGTPSSGTEQQGGGFAQQLTGQLASLTFGDPIMTPEVAEEMNQGNFTNFEKRMQSQMQTAVRQALALNVQVLRPFAEQLMEQMRGEFGSTLNQRDNNDTLTRDFPAAKDPRVAPIIKNVFDQALKNAKGNREQAVKMTKQMIGLMANTAADDLDLNVAPRGAGDSRPNAPAINWLDELTGR